VLSVVDAAGAPLADPDHLIAALDGIILLDGSWSQAKALWWRNPWLLKLRRLILAPPRPSLYGTLRKEPRADSVSTIEAAAYSLAAIEGDPALVERALAPLVLLLARHGGGKPSRAPDRRRHKRGDPPGAAGYRAGLHVLARKIGEAAASGRKTNWASSIDNRARQTAPRASGVCER